MVQQHELYSGFGQIAQEVNVFAPLEKHQMHDETVAFFDGLCTERGIDPKAVFKTGSYLEMEAKNVKGENPIMLPPNLQLLQKGVFGEGATIVDVKFMRTGGNRFNRAQFSVDLEFGLDESTSNVLPDNNGEKRVIRPLTDRSPVAVGNSIHFDLVEGTYTLRFSALDSTPVLVHEGVRQLPTTTKVDYKMGGQVYAELKEFMGELDRRDTTGITVRKPYRGLVARM